MNRDIVDPALKHLVARCARQDDEGGLSLGDRAELRRMNPLDPVPPFALWRLLTDPAVMPAVDDLGRGDPECAERALAIVVQMMAEVGASGNTRIGKALANPDDPRGAYAEPRFVRLLRARAPADVAFEARQAARWCAAKGGGINLIGFARFILGAALNHASADHDAHSIARDYFTTITASARSAAQPEA